MNPEIELDRIQGCRYEDVFAVGDDKLKEYQIAVLCREINAQGTGVKIINRLQGLGLKVVLDVDDYWILPSSHKLRRAYEHYDIRKLILDNVRAADYVTTPNKLLAQYISHENSKVLVLPNCIDTFQPQFKIEKVESDRMRFGWVGGVYHREDIQPIERSFEKLWRDKELKNKWQLCVGGFNVNDEYKAIEKIFTCNYKFFDTDYQDYLESFTPLIEHASNNQPYRRLWAKSAFEYISMYNELDVALVPLKDNNFNTCKSALKIIEAAAMGKCVIVNDTHPYKQICNSQNSIVISHSRPHKEWYEAIKHLINNPFKAQDLANQLTIDCHREFNINKITKERKDLYLWLIK